MGAWDGAAGQRVDDYALDGCGLRQKTWREKSEDGESVNVPHQFPRPA
jgi:hypothetical protein